MKAARIAVELEKAREAARFLFGSKYDERIEPWRVFVRNAAAKWKCSPLAVPPRLQREGAMPEQPLPLFAAVVDVSEEPVVSPVETGDEEHASEKEGRVRDA